MILPRSLRPAVGLAVTRVKRVGHDMGPDLTYGEDGFG
jgi:hypothetical protein